MPHNKWKIVWSPQAVQDLSDIWSHLATSASPEIADNQLRDVDRAAAMLALWPYAGRARDEIVPDLRSVPAHPYVIFYRPAKSSVEIVRVIDGRRDLEEALADR